jgi:hypothetical protein
MGKENYFNADVPCLQEPLKFRLNGNEYEVGAVRPEVMDEVIALGGNREETDERRLADVLPQQLALLTGREPEEFADADLRQLVSVVQWLIGRLNNPDAVKEAIRQAKNERRA